MMARFLLDTNIISDLMRHPYGAAAARVAEVGEENICTSVMVAAELRYGARKKDSKRLTDHLEETLIGISILPLSPPVDRLYAELRTLLERRGRTIGSNDLFIAAHALGLQCTLVTANEREFSRVPGLRVENWLR